MTNVRVKISIAIHSQTFAKNGQQTSWHILCAVLHMAIFGRAVLSADVCHKCRIFFVCLLALQFHFA